MAEIVALLVGPSIAVAITLWWQNRKEKRDAKIRLFTTLMAFRRSYPVSYEWSNALNLIDVVFSDSRQVVERWRRYYDNLHDPSPHALAERTHIYLELMSEMAHELDFPNLQQTDIDRFYTPEAHGTQADLNAECQREWLRVLRNTARFETSAIPPPPGASSAKPLADIPPLTPPQAPRLPDPPEKH
jgi:hypothetical protein